MMKCNRRQWLVVAGALCLSPRVWASSESALEKMKTFIAKTPYAEGTFTQTVVDKQGREASTPSSGRFRFLRPGCFEWHYEKPYEQTIMSNGKTLWIYDPDLRQVTVRSISDKQIRETPAGLLFGATDWEQTAQLTTVDADHIEAVFKQKEGSFERAVIGFTKDGQLAQLTLVDHFGQTTTVVFTAFTRVEQSTKSFEFSIPPDTDVLQA